MTTNAKKVICRNCNAAIPANSKICPSCGAKNKKPFYKKWRFILIITIAVIGVIGSIGGNDKDKNIDKTAKYKWPDSTLGDLIPQPLSEYGKVSYENEDSFWIDIYNISQDQFDEYIEECKSAGFTVDYSRFDSSYSADDENGYSLMVNYDKKNETMRISLNAPNDEPEEATLASEENSEDIEGNTETESTIESEEDTETELTVEPEESTPEENTEEGKENTTELVDGMRPDFKAAMDSSEEFFNEYCEFMKKYSESDNTAGMLADYTEYMAKYVDAMEKLDKIGEEELNSAELKYYTEVMGRINQKLLEVATS